MSKQSDIKQCFLYYKEKYKWSQIETICNFLVLYDSAEWTFLSCEDEIKWLISDKDSSEDFDKWEELKRINALEFLFNSKINEDR